jgi:cell division protein FtsB
MTSRSRAQLTRRRRTRLLAIAAAVLGLGVLVTGMPVSALLTQHSQLGDAAARLSAVNSANQALAAQARSLQDPSTIAGLARTEYGLVPSGQKAYVILPPSGSSPSTVAGSGHVPLDGPLVAPGTAASLALLGVGDSATDTATQGSHTGSNSHTSQRTAPSGHTSFWSRVLHTLEFWH